MKEIKLNKGFAALVDDKDFEWLNQYRWHVLHSGKTNYATMNKKRPGRGVILMHRLILNPDSKMLVDHRDGNGLNNQRSNIRIATRSQNRYNIKNYRNNTSSYKGVHCDSRYKNKWVAKISVNGKTIYLGNFRTANEAGTAYQIAAKKYHGEFVPQSSNL